jgi:hypothetical protein
MKNKKDVTNLVLFGMVLLTIGFGVYYFLPLSLVSFNFSLASTIFLGILFGMIFALGLLSVNLLPYLSILISRYAMVFEQKSLKILTLKNLIAHKERNQMTSMMISLVLGFIIFLNIAAMIPDAKEFNEITKEIGVHSLAISKNVPIDSVEAFLKKHTYAFDGWGAGTI